MWEHLSVISAITPQGKLYTWIQERAFNADDIVRFLKHLLRQISGKLMLIWDGLPAHRAGRFQILCSRNSGNSPSLAMM